MNPSPKLSRLDILRGLKKIDAKAKESGALIELSVYGGAAIALCFDVRRATRDVDAVVRGDPTLLRELSLAVAQGEGWPENWLNDGVKGFTSAEEKLQLMEGFEGGEEGGLVINVPTPEYLFAMKCMAMRPEGVEGSHDISDIKFLAREAKVKTSEQAFDLIESFYPRKLIPAKVRFGVEEIMEDLALENPSPVSDGGGPAP